MMYEEFCEGVGMKVDRKCYERIEHVYMAYDRFDTKEAIYDFYKKHDMNGIEMLYKALSEYNALLKQRDDLYEEIAVRQRELNGVIGDMTKTAMLCGLRTA